MADYVIPEAKLGELKAIASDLRKIQAEEVAKATESKDGEIADLKYRLAIAEQSAQPGTAENQEAAIDAVIAFFKSEFNLF